MRAATVTEYGATLKICRPRRPIEPDVSKRSHRIGVRTAHQAAQRIIRSYTNNPRPRHP
jgi:hypothetical protein